MTTRWRELRPIAQHASTVFVGQLALVVSGITDTIIVGQYSPHALAALSVGSALYVSVFVGLLGVLQALLPVWAELNGGGQKEALGRSFRQAVYLTFILSAFGMVLLLCPGPALRYAQVPIDLQIEVRQYLQILAWSLWPALFFRLFSTLNQSLHHPRLVTFVQLGSLLVKIPLSLWLTWGGKGVPAMGASGAALATWTVNFVMLATALSLLSRHRLYRPYALWQRLESPDWSALKALLRQGLPSGLSIFVEVTSFTLMALFISRMGTTASAAHQIAANLGALMYMVPLSLAIATSARTGHWIGAKNPVEMRRAILTGLALTLALSWLCAGLLWWGRAVIPTWYSPVAAVQLAATPLLAWVALYHAADGLQTLCVFVLRCFRITVSTFVVYGCLLWGVGLGGGYVLAYGLNGAFVNTDSQTGLGQLAMTPDAFWAASSLALMATAWVFSAMLWRAVKRQA